LEQPHLPPNTITRKELLLHMIHPIVWMKRKIQAISRHRLTLKLLEFCRLLADYEFRQYSASWWAGVLVLLPTLAVGWLLRIALFFFTGAIDAKREGGLFFLYVAQQGGGHIWAVTTPLLYWIEKVTAAAGLGTLLAVLLVLLTHISSATAAWRKL
jgi:hypothetical protein